MAATSFVKQGIKAVIYRNTGTYGSPTWTAVTLVRDLTVSAPWDMSDASTRASRVKLSAKTMMDITIGIVLRADDLDAAAVALYSAAFEDTAIDFLVLDGLISVEGSSGIRCHMLTNLTSQDQGSGNVIYNNYDLKPTYSSEGVPKMIVTGATSALTATDPG